MAELRKIIIPELIKVNALVEDEAGKLWLVASVGFEEVEWASDDDPYEVHEDEYGSYVVPKDAVIPYKDFPKK